MNNSSITFGEAIAWVLATQFIGFGIAGLTRRFVIWPRDMVYYASYPQIFPSCLAQVAMYQTMHSRHGARFFYIAATAIFCYTCKYPSLRPIGIPQFLANGLTSVSLVCVVAGVVRRADVRLAMQSLGNSDSGLGVGLGAITLDFAYIGTEPFTTPLVWTLNKMFGLIVYGWVLAPWIYYANPFGTPRLTLPNCMIVV